MTRKTLRAFVLLALLIPFCAALAQPSTPLSGAWIPEHLKWKEAPSYASTTKLFTASTKVLYFQSDGQVLLIGCVLYRAQHHLAISVGDGAIVELGNWHQYHHKIFLRYRIVYSAVQRPGEAMPGPWTRAVISVENGYFFMKGQTYTATPDLNQDAASWMPHTRHRLP